MAAQRVSVVRRALKLSAAGVGFQRKKIALRTGTYFRVGTFVGKGLDFRKLGEVLGYFEGQSWSSFAERVFSYSLRR